MSHSDDDGDWEAVIARAKMRAVASPPRRSPAPLSPRRPPPAPAPWPKAPQPWTAEVHLKLDALGRNVRTRSVPPLRSVPASPPPDEDWDVAIRRAKVRHFDRSLPGRLNRR